VNVTAPLLVDLDPDPPKAEPRWPFYVVWTVGAVVLAGVLLTHQPGPVPNAAQTGPMIGISNTVPDQRP
jgi:hypothetical protein